ncbi:MAG: hypothetical protein DMD69_00285 [Gemmatimonadetes bacterium]|nr:MAG: hypothetical protein DMD69_00285 [Gemmatimonadota bacterium]
MGETRVDLLHLLEDLRDAYAGSLEETILTEIVANSLDSGAAEIRLTTDPPAATLDVVDDGRGMSRGELRRYHDLGASTKIRGRGIGFAGVGIKLGLLACEEVVTEARRAKTHVATTWRLASRHRAALELDNPTGSGRGPRHGRAVAPAERIVATHRRGLSRKHAAAPLPTAVRDRLRSHHVARVPQRGEVRRERAALGPTRRRPGCGVARRTRGAPAHPLRRGLLGTRPCGAVF